jgi:tRNA U34 5-methylaminomethyl-2-thiouridine-forming methyltransferase MnmC
MPIPTRTTHPSDRDDLLIQVTDDGSRTLLVNGSPDAYHSGCGALAESLRVYLENSGVGERLSVGRPTHVLEIGLGTAMAMLITFDRAVRMRTPLQYVAFETDWIAASTLRMLRPGEWCRAVDVAESYLEFRSSLPDLVGRGRYHWRYDHQHAATIVVDDARRAESWGFPRFDAIYYDPFAPETAAPLWTAEQLSSMRRLIHPAGRLVTYSCSRRVRDALQQAGWRTRRVPGPPGGKREVLIAEPAFVEATSAQPIRARPI